MDEAPDAGSRSTIAGFCCINVMVLERVGYFIYSKPVYVGKVADIHTQQIFYHRDYSSNLVST